MRDAALLRQQRQRTSLRREVLAEERIHAGADKRRLVVQPCAPQRCDAEHARRAHVAEEVTRRARDGEAPEAARLPLGRRARVDRRTGRGRRGGCGSRCGYSCGQQAPARGPPPQQLAALRLRPRATGSCVAAPVVAAKHARPIEVVWPPQAFCAALFCWWTIDALSVRPPLEILW